MAPGLTVVKVGGSLFDLPDLRTRLRTWLTSLDAERILLVAGGGPTADAVRALDRAHQLGEEASHWLAIQALSLNARFLQGLLPECCVLAGLAAAPSNPASLACASGSAQMSPPLQVLDALPFFLEDEKRPGHLPHSWDVTSDSLALRAATLLSARALVLLKSIDWVESDWPNAVRAGVVDKYFPTAVLQASADLRVHVVNLRTA